MTFSNFLIASVHQSRKARVALDHGNRTAAKTLVQNAFRHVGAAYASRRPAYLSRAAHLHRLALAESIAEDTSKLLER